MHCPGCQRTPHREGELEQNFRQSTYLALGGRRYNNGHFFLEVQNNVAKLHDVTHTLQFIHGGKAESSLVQNLHEVGSILVLTSHVHSMQESGEGSSPHIWALYLQILHQSS